MLTGGGSLRTHWTDVSLILYFTYVACTILQSAERLLSQHCRRHVCFSLVCLFWLFECDMHLLCFVRKLVCLSACVHACPLRLFLCVEVCMCVQHKINDFFLPFCDLYMCGTVKPHFRPAALYYYALRMERCVCAVHCDGETLLQCTFAPFPCSFPCETDPNIKGKRSFVPKI